MRFLGLMLVWLVNYSALASNYRMGPGDVIDISVYGEPDLSVEKKLDRSGIVTFPFIGDIQATGLTTAELEVQVRDGLLGDYLVDPQVTVSVMTYRPFFIHGQVVKPGGYPYQEDLRLDKALALAGGLASRASKTNWKITRVVDGKTITLDADIATVVLPDDIIKIEQSFF